LEKPIHGIQPLLDEKHNSREERKKNIRNLCSNLYINTDHNTTNEFFSSTKTILYTFAFLHFSSTRKKNNISEILLSTDISILFAGRLHINTSTQY